MSCWSCCNQGWDGLPCWHHIHGTTTEPALWPQERLDKAQAERAELQQRMAQCREKYAALGRLQVGRVRRHAWEQPGMRQQGGVHMQSP